MSVSIGLQKHTLDLNGKIFSSCFLPRLAIKVFCGSRFLWGFYSGSSRLTSKAFLVGSPSGCRSRSTFALEERQQNLIAFPFLLCAFLVVAQPAVGLMGLPLHFQIFPVFLWSFSRCRGLGNLLVAGVHVYIQMMMTLTFVRHVR